MTSFVSLESLPVLDSVSQLHDVLLVATAGNPVGVLSQGTNQWRPESCQPYALTAQPPARLKLKLIVSSEELAYSLALRNIPLQRFSEMPDELEPLDFSNHALPTEVTFIRLNRSNPNQLPRAHFRAVNHANKGVQSLHVVFNYVDENGKSLKEFPHTLHGAFSAKGQAPVVGPRTTGEVESTAFFIPDNTKSIEVTLKKVDFVDGSEWAVAE